MNQCMRTDGNFPSSQRIKKNYIFAFKLVFALTARGGSLNSNIIIIHETQIQTLYTQNEHIFSSLIEHLLNTSAPASYSRDRTNETIRAMSRSSVYLAAVASAKSYTVGRRTATATKVNESVVQATRRSMKQEKRKRVLSFGIHNIRMFHVK